MNSLIQKVAPHLLESIRVGIASGIQQSAIGLEAGGADEKRILKNVERGVEVLNDFGAGRDPMVNGLLVPGRYSEPVCAILGRADFSRPNRDENDAVEEVRKLFLPYSEVGLELDRLLGALLLVDVDVSKIMNPISALQTLFPLDHILHDISSLGNLFFRQFFLNYVVTHRTQYRSHPTFPLIGEPIPQKRIFDDKKREEASQRVILFRVENQNEVKTVLTQSVNAVMSGERGQLPDVLSDDLIGESVCTPFGPYPKGTYGRIIAISPEDMLLYVCLYPDDTRGFWLAPSYLRLLSRTVLEAGYGCAKIEGAKGRRNLVGGN